MAKKNRLSPNQLAKLKAKLAGLKTIEDYAPPNKEYEVAKIQPIEDKIDELLDEEAQILASLSDVRDRITAEGSKFGEKMKGVGQQIIGQYGDDSPNLTKVGLVRSSERATRKPKAAKNSE